MTHEYGSEPQIQLNKVLGQLEDYNEKLELAVEWKATGDFGGKVLEEYIEVAGEGYNQAVSIVHELGDSVENYSELVKAEEYLEMKR